MAPALTVGGQTFGARKLVLHALAPVAFVGAYVATGEIAIAAQALVAGARRPAPVSWGHAAKTIGGINWRVAGVATGGADGDLAMSTIAMVVRHNTGWVMVEDGSPLDGQVVEDERPS